MSNLNPQQFVSQEWYHSGENPPGGDRLVHLGTYRAAADRTNPDSWDPPVEFPEIGRAKMWRVHLDPSTKIHPEIAADDDAAGSLNYRGPGGSYHAQAYVNQYEDPGSHSLVVHGGRIHKVEEVPDPHAEARARYRRLAETN